MKNMSLHNQIKKDGFAITIEVVPPAGPDSGQLISMLNPLKKLKIDGFSVATNPVAKARMDALVLCSIIQAKTKQPAILHCTTRDHNRIGLQALLWGAKAIGIETVMLATGDFVAQNDQAITSMVQDIDVFDLIAMAKKSGFLTGVVLDPRHELNGLESEVVRLEKKVSSGADFVVTQPVYDLISAETLANATANINIPIIMGILPLRTRKHAEFLHNKVAGIAVPPRLMERLGRAPDSVTEGAVNAKEMLEIAKAKFSGACVMPPFDHYEILYDILN